MAESLRDHIATVISPNSARAYDYADALLADPTLAAIIDLAAYYQDEPFGRLVPAEAQALLTNWRASRAMTELVRETERLGLYDEQEPER